MKKSESITALAPALIKAQASLIAAQKSKKNKLLNNAYATLDDIIKAVRPALAENGLSFIQPLTQNENGLTMETIILHESGEWISSTVDVREGPTNKGVNFLQAMGSGISYMRRYALSSMLGVATEDDDGNGPAPAKRKKQPAKPPAQKQGHWLDDDAARRKFWAWAKGALTEQEVHKALKVKSVKEFKGTKAEAMQLINDFADARNKAEIPA